MTDFDSDDDVGSGGTSPTRKTWITVKGEDTVCGVSLDPIDVCAFCLGTPERDGSPPSPFAQVGLSLNESCREIRCFKDLEVSVLSRHEGTPSERKALNYLENKAKRCPLPSHEETIQIAITALKYLLDEDFKADEITVYVVGKNLWIDSKLPVEKIEEHLAVIDNRENSSVINNGSPSEEEIPPFEHLALS